MAALLCSQTALCHLPLWPAPFTLSLWLFLWGRTLGPLGKQDSSFAGIYKGFCLDVIRNKYECELQGAKQHLEVSQRGRAPREVG